tara:strand:- start:281 stop:817 length:537 start_codon:yes stop_codon:yes gene_type:complete
MGAAGTALDIFIAYKFIQLLVVPFDKTDAYKLGIIDERGQILKKRKTLKTPEEKKAYPSVFYTLVWKMKRVLEKLPFGKTKLASIATAIYFLKEHSMKMGCSPDTIENAILNHLEDLDMDGLEESFQFPTVLEDGEYILEGKRVVISEYMEPVDIILGVPIFKINERVFTHEDLQPIH